MMPNQARLHESHMQDPLRPDDQESSDSYDYEIRQRNRQPGALDVSDSVDFDESCLPNSWFTLSQLVVMLASGCIVLLAIIRYAGISEADVQRFKEQTISEISQLNEHLVSWSEEANSQQMFTLCNNDGYFHSAAECDEARWYYGANSTESLPLEIVLQGNMSTASSKFTAEEFKSKLGYKPYDPVPKISHVSKQRLASGIAIEEATKAHTSSFCKSRTLLRPTKDKSHIQSTSWRCIKDFSSPSSTFQSHVELQGLTDLTCEFRNVYVVNGRLYALRDKDSSVPDTNNQEGAFQQIGTAASSKQDQSQPIQSSELPKSLWFGYNPETKSGTPLHENIESILSSDFTSKIIGSASEDEPSIAVIKPTQVLINNRLPYFLNLNIPDYAYSTHAFVDIFLPSWFGLWRLKLASSCSEALIPTFSASSTNDPFAPLASKTDTAGEALWPLLFGGYPQAPLDERPVHSIESLCTDQSSKDNTPTACKIEKLVVYSPSYGFYHHHAPYDLSWKGEALAALGFYLRSRLPHLWPTSLGTVPYPSHFRYFSKEPFVLDEEESMQRSKPHSSHYPSSSARELVETFIRAHTPSDENKAALSAKSLRASAKRPLRILVYARTSDESDASMHCKGCCAVNHALLVKSLEDTFSDAEVVTAVPRHESFIQQARQATDATIAISVDGGALELASVFARTNTGLIVMSRHPRKAIGDSDKLESTLYRQSGGGADFNHDGEDSAYLDLWATRLHVRKLMTRATMNTLSTCKLEYDIPLILEAVRDIILSMHFVPKKEFSWSTKGSLHRNAVESHGDSSRGRAKYPIGAYSIPSIVEVLKGKTQSGQDGSPPVPTLDDAPGFEFKQRLV